MSLDTNLNAQQSEKEKVDMALEEKAKKFRGIVAEGRKKDALVYFNALTAEEQGYIKHHQDYSWVLQSARMQF